MARIRVDRGSCGSCASASGCGLRADGSAVAGVIGIATKDSLEVGDHVVLALSDGEIARAAVRAYVIPLVFAIALAVTAQRVATVAGFSEPWLSASGPVGCLLGVFLGFAVGGCLGAKPPVPQVHRNCVP